VDDRERYENGMKVRRAVLGDAHVDRTKSKLNPFNEEFQNFITRYAWGEAWTRPGLSRHTRSLLTIGLMVALNRGDEFKLHVRAAFNNGVTRDEIKEVLLHCAIYAGRPGLTASVPQRRSARSLRIARAGHDCGIGRPCSGSSVRGRAGRDEGLCGDPAGGGLPGR